jgi:hypothetical protein
MLANSSIVEIQLYGPLLSTGPCFLEVTVRGDRGCAMKFLNGFAIQVPKRRAFRRECQDVLTGVAVECFTSPTSFQSYRWRISQIIRSFGYSILKLNT